MGKGPTLTPERTQTKVRGYRASIELRRAGEDGDNQLRLLESSVAVAAARAAHVDTRRPASATVLKPTGWLKRASSTPCRRRARPPPRVSSSRGSSPTLAIAPCPSQEWLASRRLRTAADRGCAAGRVASSCLGASRSARSHSPSSSSKVVAAKAVCTDRHAVSGSQVCGVESAARPLERCTGGNNRRSLNACAGGSRMRMRASERPAQRGRECV